MNRQLSTAKLGPVTLTVSDLGRSVRFYGALVGLRELPSEGDAIVLGAGDRAVVRLVEVPGARPAPPRATGLFHTAFLFPDRAALATVVRHIASKEYPFTGASDHLVSEAFYLDDPDGHGVELYRDRPRSEWRWNGDTVEMATAPLDVDNLLREAGEFRGAPDGTCVGHVHLKVDDATRAEAFLIDVVGLALTARYGDAASFLAAGGYHHHIGANMWQSRGGSPAPEECVRLVEVVIEVPASADVDAFEARARSAGVGVERDGNRAVIRDPWGQRLTLATQA